MSDPNALLADLRRYAEQAWRTDDPAERVSLAIGLGEAFTALDELIMREGRLPAAWHEAQLAVVRGVITELDEDWDGCEGHESLDGAHMGEAVFCDGSCRPRRKVPTTQG